MDTYRYVLNKNNVPVPEPDLTKWAKWFETNDRHVGDTMIGEIRISTVFLGVDHSFGFGKPVLFETMVFYPNKEEDMDRYITYQEAKEGHKKWVNKIKGE